MSRGGDCSAAPNEEGAKGLVVARILAFLKASGDGMKLTFPSGVDRRFSSGPTGQTRDMTSSSRIGSMGGLVTWAKSCLK